MYDLDTVADHLCVREDVGGKEDRLPLVLHPQDQVPDLLPPRRVEAGLGLVEDEHLRVVDQRLGHAQPLQHSLGKLTETEALRPLQVDELQQGGDPFAPHARREVEETAVEVEKLPACEKVVEIGILREKTDMPAEIEIPRVAPEYLGPPRRRLEKPEEHL